MNILLTLNTYYSKYAIVMLTSLFKNNKGIDFTIFVLYNDLNENSKSLIKNITDKYEAELVFIYVDKEIYAGLPTTDLLTIECYFVCLAHLVLPENIDRILYLDSDMIIQESILELYNMSFDDNFLIACGQSFEMIEGNYYRIGAKASRGEKFNSGVMLYNLKKMRKEVTKEFFMNVVDLTENNFMLADQGILNILYENKVKIISSSKYNFRIGIYENHIRSGYKLMSESPVIIHYTTRDYYRIGVPSKPWIITLTEEENEQLYSCGIKYKLNEFKISDEYMKRIHDLWWEYAKLTDI